MKLLDDGVLVRVPEERISKGGIAIPESALTVGNTKGKVVAVGPGELTPSNGTWKRKPMDIPVGSLVLLAPHAGRDVRIEDELHFLCRRKEIWCILDDYTDVD